MSYRFFFFFAPNCTDVIIWWEDHIFLELSIFLLVCDHHFFLLYICLLLWISLSPFLLLLMITEDLETKLKRDCDLFLMQNEKASLLTLTHFLTLWTPTRQLQFSTGYLESAQTHGLRAQFHRTALIWGYQSQVWATCPSHSWALNPRFPQPSPRVQ